MAQQDIAPWLLEQIRKDFRALLGDTALSGSSYSAAEDYAEAVGDALAEAFRRNLTADTLPDGKLYWNLADRVVRPMLEEDHALVADAAQAVQQQLNAQAGLGLKAQRAVLDENRVDGILQKAAAAEKFEDTAWVLDEPVRTFSRMTVDDTLKANVDFQGKAGLRPRVTRTAESECCKWCSSLAGTYTYPDVPKDVYRRHNRCRCRVEYDPGSGRRQDVWTKEWTDPEERDKIEYRKQLMPEETPKSLRILRINAQEQAAYAAGKISTESGKSATIGLNNDRYTIAEPKISKFLLKPGAKHSAEFFDVGYSERDAMKLNSDIYQQFDETLKTDVRTAEDGMERFSIFMELGTAEKKTFRTVWQRDSESEKPRLITAHREDKKK